MADIIIGPCTEFNGQQVESLYRSVGWTSYLRREGLLREAWANSLLILAACDGDQLIGVARAVGDGASILYIQDVIVHPAYQRQGIGTRLLQEILACFPDVNQTVLLTDESEATCAFYEANGFQRVQKAGCCAMLRLNEWYG